jgi:hypothetical protein
MNTRNGFLTILVLILSGANAQQLYDNFEGQSVLCYNVQKSSLLDTVVANPLPDRVNKSSSCARYLRGRQRYDNIKIRLKGPVNGVSKYATYEGVPPKFTMKVFTTAPPGTPIEIQLGKKEGNAYPEGTHSQFQAFTSKSGAWEELEFKFALIPKGSQTRESEINQLTILFYPNSNTNHVYYFDDIQGPEIIYKP